MPRGVFTETVQALPRNRWLSWADMAIRVRRTRRCGVLIDKPDRKRILAGIPALYLAQSVGAGVWCWRTWMGYSSQLVGGQSSNTATSTISFVCIMFDNSVVIAHVIIKLRTACAVLSHHLLFHLFSGMGGFRELLFAGGAIF